MKSFKKSLSLNCHTGQEKQQYLIQQLTKKIDSQDNKIAELEIENIHLEIQRNISIELLLNAGSGSNTNMVKDISSESSESSDYSDSERSEPKNSNKSKTNYNCDSLKVQLKCDKCCLTFSSIRSRSSHVARLHLELVDDKLAIIKNTNGKYDCNKCEKSFTDKCPLIDHRAMQHGLTSSLIKKTGKGYVPLIKCPVSNQMISIKNGNLKKHIAICLNNQSKANQYEKILTREEKFNVFTIMPKFSTFIFDELNQEGKNDKDMPLFYYLMLVLGLRPGIDMLNNGGFFNIRKINLNIEKDKLILNVSINIH